MVVGERVAITYHLLLFSLDFQGLFLALGFWQFLEVWDCWLGG